MSRKRPRGQVPAAPAFEHVPVRKRLDGWTPARQVAFIEVLSETGVVADACKAVGMSVESAYRLVRRSDAQSFRVAWQTAMDNAVRRVADAAIGRAIHGVPVPHYFQGEQVGEHRRFDERLTMFILRSRAPATFGDAHAKEPAAHDPEAIALALSEALRWVVRDALRELAEEPRMTIRDIPAPGEEWDEAGIEARWEMAHLERWRSDGAPDPDGPADSEWPADPDWPKGQGGEVA